jgi:hypothetical protein
MARAFKSRECVSIESFHGTDKRSGNASTSASGVGLCSHWRTTLAVRHTDCWIFPLHPRNPKLQLMGSIHDNSLHSLHRTTNSRNHRRSERSISNQPFNETTDQPTDHPTIRPSNRPTAQPGRAVAQSFSHRFSEVEVKFVVYKVEPRQLSLEVLQFSVVNYQSIDAPYSFLHQSWLLQYIP